MKTFYCLLPLLTAHCAAALSLEITPRGTGTCTTAAFETGSRLFANRDYTLAEPPAALKGMTFLRAPIEGVKLRCTVPGEVVALTPPDVPRATSIASALLAQG